MTVHSFQKADMLVFVNKLLQDMKSTFRVETVNEFALGDKTISFEGNQGKLVAQISDFGLGDIGFKSIDVTIGAKELHYLAEKQPAMSARILPREEDYKAYSTELKGAKAAGMNVQMIQAVCDVKLGEVAQVVKDGVVMPLKDFEVLRPRPNPGVAATTLSM